MAVRNNVNDFIRDLLQVISVLPDKYTVITNSDGSISAQRVGALYTRKIFYFSSGGAVTDANPQGDYVRIISQDGSTSACDAQIYLNNFAKQ